MRNIRNKFFHIYLAGPIQHCDDSECIDWREQFASNYSHGVCYDPMRRDYRDNYASRVNEIVLLDKRDIKNSDVMVVGYTRPSSGTAMEIYYAHTLGLPIVVINDEGLPLSPWILYHATTVTDSLNCAVTWIEENVT